MKYLLGSALFLALFFIVGCGDLGKPDNPKVDGGEVVVNFSPELMKQSLIKGGVADANTTVFGYIAYKIPYTTINEEGEEVIVSGLMVVPTGMPEVVTKQIGFSLVSDDHGTIFANDEAPGVIGEKTNAPSGSAIILTALAGFVTLQPDYIGFGDSKDHYHPYLLKKSLASATVDFINEAREFAGKNDIKLNGQLFLTGYSEGGYAALATLQKIEDEYLAEIPVTLAAPMAGPYAMTGMAMKTLSRPTLTVPSFMANVGYSYVEAYDKELRSVFNEPYASRLDRLLGGDYNRTEVDKELTTQTTGVDGLFNPLFVNSFFTEADNWFLQSLMQNDIYRWKAITPIRLIHCIGDDIVPFAMSKLTEGNMTEVGSTSVETIPVEVAITQNPATPLRYGHGECGKYAYAVAAKIFGDIRKTAFGY
ncbi:MAG: hypothetical protein HF962_07715 [Sulfurovum sp.]|nr:hypothetical protein [Sulfurovum sp.]